MSKFVRRGNGGGKKRKTALHVSLYTIVPSPIWYGVWHKQKGSVGGVYCAMAVQ